MNGRPKRKYAQRGRPKGYRPLDAEDRWKRALEFVAEYRKGRTLEQIGAAATPRKLTRQSIHKIIKNYETVTGETVIEPGTQNGMLMHEVVRPKRAPATTKAPRLGRKRAEEVLSITGIVPLDEMLRIIARHRNKPSMDPLVLDACKAAAPYLHAKLAPIEHTGTLSLEQVLERLTPQQLLEFAAALRLRRGDSGNRGAGEGADQMGAGRAEPPATGSVH